jgi:riboflavin-specific deaminase-like protein
VSAARLTPAGPLVIGQLGQSLDGRIATVSGESRWINGDCALDHLHGLRAEVDAVVVGVGTALTDDPQLTVRRRPGRDPARVVIDPRGRAPAGLRMFQRDADGTRRISLRAEGASAPPAGVEAVTLAAPGGRLDPLAIVAALRAEGLSRLLIEGGARTLSAFLDADALDRLHLLVAPTLIGAGRSGLELAPEPSLARARRPTTRVIAFADGDVLFDCDLRRPRAG